MSFIESPLQFAVFSLRLRAAATQRALHGRSSASRPSHDPDIEHVQKFLGSLPKDKLAQAAFNSKAYARALMYMEDHLRQHSKDLQSTLGFLQVREGRGGEEKGRGRGGEGKGEGRRMEEGGEERRGEEGWGEGEERGGEEGRGGGRGKERREREGGRGERRERRKEGRGGRGEEGRREGKQHFMCEKEEII